MRKLLTTIVALVALMMVGSVESKAQTPRPEYPRPQFERADWVNLNGTWTYAFDFGRTGGERGWNEKQSFDNTITVPFCPESKLSGVEHTDFINSIWYQRTINIPAGGGGKKIFLNFGAVDYDANIYIDGKYVANHKGAGSSFSVDITNRVKPGSSHNLIVRVNDDLRGGMQPGGKQSTGYYSAGCSYTRVTGIWQTVWMEAVEKEGLKSVFAVPDIDQKQLVIHPQFYTEKNSNSLVVTVYDGSKVVATKTVPCTNNSIVVIPFKTMKLWTPETPYLYDVTYKVVSGGKTIDEVKSYAGMRKIHCEGGYFYLNNKPYYQRLVLDQGFYPDGVWTAPSDEALKHDIEMSKEVGFNGARLHQKNFEERYFYWADKLGYITWAEFASWGLNVNNELAARNTIGEWTELVERDRNHPSIVTWTPFNETWGAADTGAYPRMMIDLYNITKAMDPSRPINDASGDSHVLTDIWTVHNYKRGQDLQNDLVFKAGEEPYRNININDRRHQNFARYDGQPYMVDEFGGLGWIKPEERGSSWGYGAQIETLEEFYQLLKDEVEALKASKHVVGFCYTQITDVEQEKNGIYYYDRTPKFDSKRLKEIFESIPSVIENPVDLTEP